MTMREFYEKVGGDYDDVIKRFGAETMAERFNKKFLNDPSFQTLVSSLNDGLTEESFRAVHTLKGVCQNLGYGNLGKVSSDMTELLRAGSVDAAKDMLDSVKNEYDKVVELISKYFDK